MYKTVFIILFIFPTIAFGAETVQFNPLPVAQELYCPTVTCDLETFFLILIRDILRIIPVVSVLFIIIGGFKLISSQGNEEAIVAAKKTILWAILGFVIAMLAFSIIAIIQNFLGVEIT